VAAGGPTIVPPFTVRHEAALLEVEDLVGSGVQRQLRLDGPVVTH
jgi:hypothetical protein